MPWIQQDALKYLNGNGTPYNFAKKTKFLFVLFSGLLTGVSDLRFEYGFRTTYQIESSDFSQLFVQ